MGWQVNYNNALFEPEYVVNAKRYIFCAKCGHEAGYNVNLKFKKKTY